ARRCRYSGELSNRGVKRLGETLGASLLVPFRPFESERAGIAVNHEAQAARSGCYFSALFQAALASRSLKLLFQAALGASLAAESKAAEMSRMLITPARLKSSITGRWRMWCTFIR